MAEIMLVGNPSRRKRRKKGRRRMSALQRKYFGGGRKRRRRSSASAVPRRRRRRRALVAINPSPRRRRRRSYSVVRRRRRRINPSLRGSLGSLRRDVVPTLKSGFVGATGALGLDLLWGYGSKYLPAQIAGSALAQYAAKLFGAILVGVIGNQVFRGRGRDLAVGATTVVLHDALKAQLKASFPTLALGEYLTYAPSTGSLRRAGPMLSTGIGEYLSGIPNNGSGGVDDDMSYTGEWNGDGMNGY